MELLNSAVAVIVAPSGAFRWGGHSMCPRCLRSMYATMHAPEILSLSNIIFLLRLPPLLELQIYFFELDKGAPPRHLHSDHLPITTAFEVAHSTENNKRYSRQGKLHTIYEILSYLAYSPKVRSLVGARRKHSVSPMPVFVYAV